jgi:tRNA (adenine37-N6)-methyltransferase
MPPFECPNWTTAIIAVALSSSLWFIHHIVTVRDIERKWNQERQAERKGRIRAEIKLRKASKQEFKDGEMTMKRIGTVFSPYSKRMGTPRQGSLVPSSRGFIQLVIPMETLDGIDNFSHAWIIFEFHANTNLSESKKTKIRPPRADGAKFGQLATRSPHRPNPIGLSLVSIDRLDVAKRQLYISAFDLVNGTPVYDIKPCVPWDVPGMFDGSKLMYPSWVQEDDKLSKVSFTLQADSELKDAVSKNLLAPFYTVLNGGFEAAARTLEEILTQDPRASRKRGASTSQSEPPYSIPFCQVKVEFRVLDSAVVVIRIVQEILDENDSF